MRFFKVNKRTGPIKNVGLFLLIILFINYIELSLIKKVSAFGLSNLLDFARNESWLIIISFIGIISIFRLSKWSLFFMPLAALSSAGHSLYLLQADFNKLIMIILFLQIVVSFYFFINLRYELRLSAYNPCVSGLMSFFKPKLALPVIVHEEGHESAEIMGQLTNWDSESCYIKLNSMEQFKGNDISLIVDHMGLQFRQDGTIVSIARDNQSVGILFKESQNNSPFGWKDFYYILDNKGILPEYVI